MRLYEFRPQLPVRFQLRPGLWRRGWVVQREGDRVIVEYFSAFHGGYVRQRFFAEHLQAIEEEA